jgi:hypothetical protein
MVATRCLAASLASPSKPDAGHAESDGLHQQADAPAGGRAAQPATAPARTTGFAKPDSLVAIRSRRCRPPRHPSVAKPLTAQLLSFRQSDCRTVRAPAGHSGQHEGCRRNVRGAALGPQRESLIPSTTAR